MDKVRTHAHVHADKQTYIPLYHTTSHRITLHYVAERYITAQYDTLNCMALHGIAPRYNTVQHGAAHNRQHVALRKVVLRYCRQKTEHTSLSLSNFLTIFDIASNYIAAHCAACHRITVLHYITYHYTTLQTSCYFSIAHGNTVNMFA